jgi:hypothetical protein
MRLDIAKLEMAKHRGSNIIARCPACAETGNDCKGEHLFVNESGHFGCVVYPGAVGKQHRQRIFALVGIRKESCINIEVRKPTFTSFCGTSRQSKGCSGILGMPNFNSGQP